MSKTFKTGVILDGALQLKNGTSMLSSVTQGAVEFDGSVFYSTPNATPGRTLNVGTYYYALNADYGIDFSTSASLQSLLESASKGITVAAGTTYEYELYAAIKHQVVTVPGISLSYNIGYSTVSGTPVVAHVSYVDYASSTTSFTTAMTPSNQRITSAISFSAGVASGSRYNILKVRGVIRVTGSGSAKIYPAISSSSTAADNITTVSSGTFFKLTPIGNGTVTSVGTWA